ncbi:MAG: hypothetical protein WCP85_31360 [Mariniphaga sp.]
MLKFSCGLIAIIALSFNGLAQSDVSKARWNSKQITIDGNDREWVKPLNFYDDKTGLLFAISNDNQNLYLAFSCNNEFKMRKLMNAGWSVELSSKEKNRKFNTMLTFPSVKMEGVGQNRPGNQFEKKLPGNPAITSYSTQIKTIAIKGFQSNQTEIKLRDHNGIDIAVGYDSLQNLVCEIAIPVKELMAENSVQLNELITMSVTVNAMERPNSGGGQSGRSGGRESSQMSEMGGGQHGGGMGGGRSGGGMRQGGGQGGTPSDRSGLFERASFKQKFVLTKN